MAPKSENELKLDRLRARRENLFRRLQLCYDAGELLKADRSDPTKLENFKIRHVSMLKVMSEYREVVNEIVCTKQAIKPDEPVSYSTLDAAEDLYDRIEYTSSQYVPRPVSSNLENTNSHKTRLHMPKIEIVKFDATDLSLWPVFYENFRQLIHDNTEFSKAEKLQYLLGSLAGKALKTVSAIEIVPNNYDIIFKLLVDTYHDKKLLSNMYLDRLLSFRAISNNNPDSLQLFLERFDTNVAALYRLNLENLGDYIITHIAMSKLSQETINAFELVRDSQELPNYEELLKFIRKQSKIAVVVEKTRKFPNHPTHSTFARGPKTFVTNNNNNYSKGRNCLFCDKGVHLLKDCQLFKNSTHEQKFKLIKDKHLCLNCFSNSHKVSACISKFSCRFCGSKHHSLLHKTNVPTNSFNVNNNVTPSTSTSSTDNDIIRENRESVNIQTLCSKINVIESNKPNIVLLSTALVKTTDRWGKEHILRFLCDNASMSNLLTFDSCKKLGLPYTKFNSKVFGIGNMIKPIKGSTNLKINSVVNPGIRYSIEVLIIDEITTLLPEVKVNCDSFDHLVYLPLADPTFHTPGNIDGIIGATVFSEILGSQKIVSNSPGMPIAVESALGYLVMGPAPYFENRFHKFCPPIKTHEDNLCETLYLESVSRDNSGRYTVALPFKDDPSLLGNSLDLARSRLISLEKRLANSPGAREIYSSIIQDYLDQGHMSLVKNENLNRTRYFIPHHCVTKSESLSTPNRIVFDASMKTDSKYSLNDILHRGPKLQNNIFTILLNFRLFPVCMCADLKAMYRQINLIEAHRPFQSILWRFNARDDISIYELTTVSFGISSSPFLSLRTIKQLIEDESHTYPDVVEYVERDMFMDDLLCGFQMVKWVSNSPELLSHIPEDIKLPSLVDFEKGNWKVLGLQWNPFADFFCFSINLEKTLCTKRNMLSLISRTYDPLDWDESAPQAIEKTWEKFQDEFSLLNELKIPRHVLVFENTSLEIIGFADASSAGLASVVYIRAVDTSGHVSVTFLCAQTKVAPISSITLPRLELAAATNLASLIDHVRDTFSKRTPIKNIYAFSDSMITLNWIHSSPRKWKTFLLTRYKLLDAIVNQYWKRWHLEYLSTLQSRQKWNTPSCPAKVGTLVVIVQDNLPPLQWPLAIIEKLHCGKDGVARIALVKTKTGTYLRPIVKLCPLPNQ
ncbi:hypothetical protein NQ317_001038 [Molorchus minor]|uniref:DUF5641 domain-containing protein n=1 Tax=Molorchus minor TaxID=1323400 RepID=A0ABQ9IRR3_9CUCU|nr:hypothetical protein NQ317_001038 [Molorchus minor]